MKVLLLALAIISLSSCGKKSEPNHHRATDQERDCLVEKSTLCMPLYQVQITSGKLPETVSVTFSNEEGQSYEAVNECRPDRSSIVIRGAMFDVVAFQVHGYGFDQEWKITIKDLGANCDNDALFFEEVVEPVVDRTSDVPLISFTLHI